MPYNRIACLGSGFFGEVWLEEDAALKRLCAAKYLNPARLPPGAIFTEAQVMLDAEHENVVRVYSADLEGVTPVIRMEYLPAGSVADRYRGEPLPVVVALHSVEEASRGVEALHARGVLHRDLKPANLLIGGGGRIKVSDFGLACEVANVAGAPPWGYTEHLPPEAVGGTGAIDSVVGDVYALGVTLYRLLNGDDMLRAVATPGADLLRRIAEGKYPDRSNWQLHVHDDLRRVTRKAMHREPGRRYASASELRHALERVRPKVSWVPVPVAGSGSAWDGVGPNGSQCVARLGQNQRGKYVFEFQRRGPSGILRTSRGDQLVSDTIKEAKAHAAKVLQRVAVDGS